MKVEKGCLAFVNYNEYSKLIWFVVDNNLNFLFTNNNKLVSNDFTTFGSWKLKVKTDFRFYKNGEKV